MANVLHDFGFAENQPIIFLSFDAFKNSMPSPLTKIVLKKGKDRSLLNFHPWVFSGAIEGVDKQPEEGEVVEVYSFEKKFLATGHFHQGGISVRIFSFKQIIPDENFWIGKIKTAYQTRAQLGFSSDSKTNCYRLVHGEGDQLPGLIIDFYNRVAVIQAHTNGMYLLRNIIAKSLKEIYGESLLAVYDKSSDTLGKNNSLNPQNEYLFRSEDFIPENHWVKENEMEFFVDWELGQKTAFFLDQRDNRRLLLKYSNGKKVLNTFAYSGGFSVFALAGNALSVDSVDSSVKAEAWANKNIEKNFPNSAHRFFREDVADFMKKNIEPYDTIILDPPAFAKHRSSLRQASIGYQNLNASAIRRIKPGGIIFTFSCSQVIDKKLFRQLIFAAAAGTGRQVTILHQLSQPADHPINIYHPEGEYLKGLVLRVE